MPPKKRPSATATSKGKQPTSTGTGPKTRQSKLAKENDLTAEEETEIKEAFHLFAIEDASGWEDEKEGIIRREDVRRCLIALNLPPSSPSELTSILSTLDPTNENAITYPHFLSIASLKLHNKRSLNDSSSGTSEVEAAYKLFTRGTNGPITIAHLRRVARELKEEANVTDELLRGMVLEANGGAGVTKGVGLEEFESVMRRAGVF